MYDFFPPRTRNFCWPLVGLLALSSLAACSQDEASEPAVPGTACAVLTAAEASGILGEDVVAKPDNGAIDYGMTSCAYFSRDGHKFRLTFSYEPKGAISKRAVYRFPPPGPATPDQPYADLGDGAVISHGVLFIVVGEAAVSIDAQGSLDKHAMAARILQSI